MRTNSNGGKPCTMREAVGYSKEMPRGQLLVSGIWSLAAPWQGFEYQEDAVRIAEAAPRLAEYQPVGMIAQLPACRADYTTKNSAGGRKALSGYLGAAYRTPKDWTSGLGVGYRMGAKEVQVRMRIDHELAMGPEADLTWLALRLRTQLIERIERLERSQVEYRMAA